MNLLGLLPFGSAATGNIMVTAALAILSLVVIEVGGAIHLGPRAYMKTIVYVPEGLPWFGKIPMALIMTPVEAIAKLARIFALAIRLFANMTAGHLVILSLVGLIFMAAGAGAAKWAIAPAPVLITSVFIGLVRHPH
jgi:F-type H+-transporting ATPase subunit a